MADITVQPENWRRLRNSANCYLPKLVQASASSRDGFTNSDLHRAGQAKGLKQFSAHIVGAALGLKAITHGKAEDFIKAYAGLPAALREGHGPIGETDIVAALLTIPNLKQLMAEAGLDAPTLATATGISERAIAHAMDGGRITGGIANAIHKSLSRHGAALPNLGAFATSNARPGSATTKITGLPFTLTDLMIEPPAGRPELWP